MKFSLLKIKDQPLVQSPTTNTPVAANPNPPNPATPSASLNTSVNNPAPVSSSQAKTSAEVVEEAKPLTLPSNYIDQVVALYDFQSTQPETISFQRDAVINIIEKTSDWWLGEYQGKIGLLPNNYVKSIGNFLNLNFFLL